MKLNGVVLSLICLGLALVSGGLHKKLSKGSPSSESMGMLESILGSSRSSFSKQMVYKADVFYHGGVEHKDNSSTDCSLVDSHAAQSDDHKHDDNCPHCRALAAQKAHGKHKKKRQDWWQWINSGMHPQGHIHATGRYEKEVVPWLWASVKSDPHNIKAYEIAAYWVGSRLDKKDNGIKVLLGGIKKNPKSSRLQYALATYYYHTMKSEKLSYEAFCLAAEKWQKQDKFFEKGDKEYIGSKIFSYLGHFERRNKNYKKAIKCYSMAVKLAPDNLKTTYLRKIEEIKILLP